MIRQQSILIPIRARKGAIFQVCLHFAGKLRELVLLRVLSFGVALCILLNACNTIHAEEKPTDATTLAPTIIITFWHPMSGNRGEVVNTLVESFNSTYSNIHVDAQFTGSYDENMVKSLAAYRAGDPPTIALILSTGTQTMLDSNAIVPVYSLDKGDFNWNAVVQPVMNYYAVDGKLHCMPFNNASGLLYYNEDMFIAAGLDPDNPPRTWGEIRAVAKIIMDAGVAEGGISMGWPAWYFEQMFAMHDQMFTDNSNGREGLATRVLFNNDFGLKVLTLWQQLADERVLVYGGKEYSANDPFLAGQFPMLLQSTSSLGGIQKKAEFKLRTAYLPRFAGDYPVGNTILGGGCLWLFSKTTLEQQQAAWEFFKYLFTPKQSILWHKETGYFPSNILAYEQLKAEGWFEEEPNYATAFDQILSGMDTLAAAGPRLGNFAQIDDTIVTMIADVVIGSEDPKVALDKATERCNQLLADYAQLHE